MAPVEVEVVFERGLADRQLVRDSDGCLVGLEQFSIHVPFYCRECINAVLSRWLHTSFTFFTEAGGHTLHTNFWVNGDSESPLYLR